MSPLLKKLNEEIELNRNSIIQLQPSRNKMSSEATNESISFRMLDYKEWNNDMFVDESGSGSASGGSDIDVDDSSKSKFKDNKEFSVQVFGKDEKGESYCVFVREVYPFFFVKVGDDWKKSISSSTRWALITKTVFSNVS